MKKYARDDLKTASPNRSKEILKSNKVIESEPVNLTSKVVNESLLKLCSREPSFVPTPNSIDWNDLQLAWLNFKWNVRWRAFFGRGNLQKKISQDYEISQTEPPKIRSKREPPIARIPSY